MRCFEEIMRLDPQAKVIIMSGYDDSGMEEEKRKLIKGYITKPVDIHHVLSLLASVLQPEH
jgi:DNA-binding NtrC family response regulator